MTTLFLLFDFFDTNFSQQIENKFFQSFEIDLSTQEKKTELMKKKEVFSYLFSMIAKADPTANCTCNSHVWPNICAQGRKPITMRSAFNSS